MKNSILVLLVVFCMSSIAFSSDVELTSNEALALVKEISTKPIKSATDIKKAREAIKIISGSWAKAPQE